MIAVTISCSSDDEDEEEATFAIAEVVGSWNATLFFLVDIDGTENDLDVLAAGGTVNLVIESNNSFTFTTSFPETEDRISTGTFQIIDGDLFLLFDGSASGDLRAFEGDFDGINLELNGGPIEVDVDGDGVLEMVRVLKSDYVRA